MNKEYTDRKLLELAAKAAGGLTNVDELGWIVQKENGERGSWWNPLEDDSDALRLAVDLGITLNVSLITTRDEGNSYVHTKEVLGYDSDGYASFQASYVHKESHGDDPYKATRRAIVRAAAEIGESVE